MITARKGFLPRIRNALAKTGASLYGVTAPDIKLSPINRMPKPVMISPSLFFFSSAPNSTIKTPIPTTRGARNSGLHMLPHSLSDTIHAVTVVPIFAPIITPTACERLIMPALTNPTTITVVAELLWIIAVIPAPTNIAIRRFLVRKLINFFTLSPADFCSPSAIICIPYRKRPRPPINSNSSPKSSSVIFILPHYKLYFLSFPNMIVLIPHEKYSYRRKSVFVCRRISMTAFRLHRGRLDKIIRACRILPAYP